MDFERATVNKEGYTIYSGKWMRNKDGPGRRGRFEFEGPIAELEEGDVVGLQIGQELKSHAMSVMETSEGGKILTLSEDPNP